MLIISVILGVSILFNFYIFYRVIKIERKIEGIAYEEILDGSE